MEGVVKRTEESKCLCSTESTTIFDLDAGSSVSEEIHPHFTRSNQAWCCDSFSVGCLRPVVQEFIPRTLVA